MISTKRTSLSYYNIKVLGLARRAVLFLGWSTYLPMPQSPRNHGFIVLRVSSLPKKKI